MMRNEPPVASSSRSGRPEEMDSVEGDTEMDDEEEISMKEGLGSMDGADEGDHEVSGEGVEVEDMSVDEGLERKSSTSKM